MIEYDDELTIEWNDGEPPEQGWYDCLQNGEEKRLQWWICKTNPRKRHWKNTLGHYVEFDGPVCWTGKASASMW